MNEQELTELGEHIAASIDEDMREWRVAHGELVLRVRADHIVKALQFLRDDPMCRFSCLIDLCGVDYPEREKRFDIVYHLLSLHQNQRIRVKARLAEDGVIPSVTDLFPVANWFERETFDMYGVRFSGHPDLRRILTDYGFEGFPLRKDFPLTGEVELRYDDEQKRVVYAPVELTQEFRNFDFLSPWEGAQHVLPGDEKAEEKNS